LNVIYLLAEYKEAFELFDKNRDGAISSSELKEVMLALGNQPSETDIKAMMRQVDADGTSFEIIRSHENKKFHFRFI